MAEMTSRERVLAALNHQEPDRVPLDIGGGVAVDAIRAEMPGTKIIIGGAPVTPDFTPEIGADGFAPDAGSAVDVAQEALRS